MVTLQRRQNPLADMLTNWFDNESGFGLTPNIRIEDFVEDGTYVLKAELPGIDPEKDVTIDVEDDVLTIRGERKEEKKDKNRQEFHYGSFLRSVTMPRGAKMDEIQAEYKDGVLQLRVPLGDAAKEPRHVPIQRVGA